MKLIRLSDRRAEDSESERCVPCAVSWLCGQPMINHTAAWWPSPAKVTSLEIKGGVLSGEGFCQGAGTIRPNLEGGCSWLNRCSWLRVLLIRGLLWGAVSPATLVYMQNDVHSRKVPPEKWSTDRAEKVLQGAKVLPPKTGSLDTFLTEWWQEA